MMDSLPYRNDAAQVLRRLIRSLPTRKGVLGVATCDKGLPAMMMALASMREMPCVLVPGGVTLPARGGEDAGKVQTIGARFAHGELSLDKAREFGCKACGTPGGGCQFLGTAATAQVVAEALGLALPHTALGPSGQRVWKQAARRSAAAAVAQRAAGISVHDILTEGALRNAMVVHAAFGGSTNLLLHLPAIAYCAGLRRPSVDDWADVNRQLSGLLMCCRTDRSAIRPCECFLPAGYRRSCSTCASQDCSTFRFSRPRASAWMRFWTSGRRPNGAASFGIASRHSTEWTLTASSTHRIRPPEEG